MISILKIREFINKESMYFYLLCFIAFFNIALLLSVSTTDLVKQKSSDIAKEVSSLEEIARANLLKDPVLLAKMTAVSLLIIFVVLTGIFLNILTLFKLNLKRLFDSLKTKFEISWSVWDVCKVIILFTFFLYILSVIEIGLVKIFPQLDKIDNLRLLFNAAFNEIMIMILILYFVFGGVKKIDLSLLGIRFNNFFKNSVLSVAKYIQAAPLFVIALLVVVFVADKFNFEPEPQEILGIFLKENDTFFLIFLGIFACIIGPIVEEIFFRGFMYPALKNRLGIFWGVMITSVFFALLHGNVAAFLPILILGILLIYIYERTKSLTYSILVHMIHNSVMLYFVFVFKTLL